MSLFVGETVAIKAQATDPLTDQSVVNATATVEFFNPAKDPVNVPGDRPNPDHVAMMTYNPTVVNNDGSLGAYVGFQDTSNFAPGTWTYRVVLAGAYNVWRYAKFTLSA